MSNLKRLWPALFVLSFVFGCDSSESTEEGGSDAGSMNAGSMNAGSMNAGSMNAGSMNAGSMNAGTDVMMTSSGVIEVVDQTLESPFQSIQVKLARLPVDLSRGSVQIVTWDGVNAGEEELGLLELTQTEPLADATLTLNERLVGTQVLVARLLNGADRVVVDENEEPVQAVFTVTGDLDLPNFSVQTQQLDPENLRGVLIDQVYVPERFERGLWLAVYEDDNGAPGDLLGKESYDPGTHDAVTLNLSSELDRTQTVHLLFRLGTRTGSWSSSSEVITTFGLEPITSVIQVDSILFHPNLEVEDQQIETENVITQEISIRKVLIPQEYFYGWVAIYTDMNGELGEEIGHRQYRQGLTENTCDEGVCTSACGCTTVELTRNLQGEQDLHAVLYNGQTWSEAQNNPMIGVDGQRVQVTFKIGATDLSYLRTPPITTTNPRFITVERAYSYDKMAWVVIARDDNGSPGRVLAQRRVPYRYAGRVHFTSHSLGSGTICEGGLPCAGQFLRHGSLAEYATTNYPDDFVDPEFYRYTVRGNENLHVMMFEDDPQDGLFTWTPGGNEDVPVLTATGEPITSRLSVTVNAAIDNSQKDSSRYYSPCPLSQHYENPTILPVDCRCHVNIGSQDFPECSMTIAQTLNMSYGEGVRAKTHNFGVYRSGFTNYNTHELIGLLVWKDAQTVWPENQLTLDVGAVIAIDPDTRARRVISGRYYDQANGIQTVGDGPVLAYPFEVQPGPDGYYYVATYNYVRINNSLKATVDIVRVDPASGDRTMVWRSNHLGFNLDNQPNPYGHCANGRSDTYGYASVQIGRKSFGVDDEGNFYLSYAHNGNDSMSDGIGIIKVSPDGSSCDFVTRTKTGANNTIYQGVNIGSGPEPQAGPYKGMLVRNGKLYVSTQLDDDLYEVDIATGDRVALHTEDQDRVSGGSGTHVLWDSYRDLIWQMGMSNAVLMYDPANADVTPLGCPTAYRDYQGINCKQLAAWGGNGLLTEKGGWFHPSDSNIFFAVNSGVGIVRLDLQSGNSDLFVY